MVLAFSCLGRAQPAETSAVELVRRIVGNELKAENQDYSHWMFRLETEKPNERKTVDEVVETKDGDLKRPILIDGRELTAEEQDKRMQQLIHNPAALRKSLNDKNQDTARSQRLLKMLPDAFVFHYGDRRGDLVELNFSPNPHFQAHTREAQVFHAMEGSVWIDSKQARLAEITGHLTREVKFGGGLLGHLDKGGEFEVKQAEVAPGYWELTLLNVQMKGKAFFFKTISVQQKYSRSSFKQMPDDLTIPRAAEILRKQVASDYRRPQNSSAQLVLRQFHLRWLGQSANGNALGLPHLQPAAVDSAAQTAHCMTQRPGDPSGGVFGEADALLQAGVCEVMRLYTSLRSVFIVFLLRFEFFSRYPATK